MISIRIRGRTAHQILRNRVFARRKPWKDLRCFVAKPTPTLPSRNEEKGPTSSKLAASAMSSPSPSSSILPGIGLCTATAIGGFSIASALTAALTIPVSGIPVSILLGLAIKNNPVFVESNLNYSKNNSVSVSATCKPGIVFCTKTVLQGGIVCVAAKLSFLDLLTTGFTGLPVVLSSIGAGLLFIPLAGRVAGLPSNNNKMALLLAAGTSICGVTAITALAPAIHASHRDVAVAVANTVAFGTIGMLTYPFLFHALCSGNSEQVGMCLGVAIHDTSQVLGAALLYKETYGDEIAFQVAAVTKLVRNLGLAVAIPLLTYQHHHHTSSMQKSESEGTETNNKQEETLSGLTAFTKYVPPFLIAFVAMTVFRSGGDFFMQDVITTTTTPSAYYNYAQVMDFVGNDLSKCALGTAMAGVGLSTDKASLQGVGWKPFAVGLSGALVVGGTGFTVAMLTV